LFEEMNEKQKFGRESSCALALFIVVILASPFPPCPPQKKTNFSFSKGRNEEYTDS
jgi:hypothetical protein